MSMKLPAMAIVAKLMTAEEFAPLPDEGVALGADRWRAARISPLTMWPGEGEANLARRLRTLCPGPRWAV